jgi:hypothetical protein
MMQDKPNALGRPRFLAAAARCMIAVAGIAAVAACGSVSATGSSGSGSAPAPKASLNITMQGAPGTAAKHWTLRCDPAGGTHPNAAATCTALLAVKNPFGTPKAHQMCPMIMASSKKLIFTGTWYGKKINRTILDGGCDLTRWTRLSQALR